jgi:hypothetical protein
MEVSMTKTTLKGVLLAALLAAVSVANAQGDGQAREQVQADLAHQKVDGVPPSVDVDRDHAEIAFTEHELRRTNSTQTADLGATRGEFRRSRYGCATGGKVTFRVSRTPCPVAPAPRD